MASQKTPSAPDKKPAKKPFEVELYAPPGKKAQQSRAVDPPTLVEAPSLEDLSVRFSASEPFTVEDVQHRFQELARPLARERARSLDEPMELFDEVLLDVAGFSADDKLLPFSVHTDTWVSLEPDPQLPGLFEALLGEKPGGKGYVVDLTLPADYAVESLRGAPVRFTVNVQAAREVTYPDFESPEFLEAFGRGKTFAEAARSVLEQLQDEHVQLLQLRAQQEVLAEVARRTRVVMEPALINEEIRRAWGASEGQAVVALELSDAEQQSALEAWLKDPALREEAETRLRISSALKAIAQRDGLTLTPEWMDRVLQEEAEASGVSPQEVEAALRADPEQKARFEQAALQLLVIDHVMGQAQIEYAES